MRVPNRALSRASERNSHSVQAEIAQERAAALGRMAARLDEAPASLREWDAEPPADADAAVRRGRLVARAGEALWYYVVQREACGLRDVDEVLREYRVPREVALRMGPARPAGGGAAVAG